jgi:hypothetical protein
MALAREIGLHQSQLIPSAVPQSGKRLSSLFSMCYLLVIEFGIYKTPDCYPMTGLPNCWARLASPQAVGIIRSQKI